MVALKDRRDYLCREYGALVVYLFDLYVLWTNDDVYGFVVLEAFVYALEYRVAELDFAVLEHYARKNGALADEVCNERIGRLVIDLFG